MKNMKSARYALLTLACFILAACARPQYLNPENTTPAASQKGSVQSGCLARFKISNACVDIKWERLPTEKDFGSFIFTTTDGASGILTDFTSVSPANVILWMPSMGHGSTPVTVEQIAPGIYRANKVFFIMKGEWEIRFQIGDDQATYATFI